MFGSEANAHIEHKIIAILTFEPKSSQMNPV